MSIPKKIVELGFEDYPSVQKLWKTANLSFRPIGRDDPENISKQISSGLVAMLGIRHNEQIIAVIMLSHDGRKGWINRLAVEPQFRSKGLAKQLLKEAENFFFSRGIMVYSALVFRDNVPSRKLFEECGYSEDPDILYYSKRESQDV